MAQPDRLFYRPPVTGTGVPDAPGVAVTGRLDAAGVYADLATHTGFDRWLHVVPAETASGRGAVDQDRLRPLRLTPRGRKRVTGWGWAAATTAAAGVASGMAFAAEPCAAIHFPRGATELVVDGTARSDSMTCYTFETAVGQTAHLRITKDEGGDIAFNVADLTHGTYVVDNRADYSFRTEGSTYKVDVYRTFARGAPAAFAMLVSIE